MNTRTGKMKWLVPGIAGLLAGLAGGYWIGRVGSDDRENAAPKRPVVFSSARRPAETTRQREVAEPDERSAAAPTVVPARPDVYRLPKAAVDRLLARLYDYDDEPDMLSHGDFGVPPDLLPAVNQSISDAVKELNGLEVKNSRMEKTRDGDVNFVIKAFPNEAAKIREKLLFGVRMQLAGFDDERGELLGGALMRCRKFRASRKDDESILCREVADEDGKKSWKILFPTSGHDGKGGVWGGLVPGNPSSSQQEMLNRLMAKHFPNP
jgi:hypothetical protein